MNLIKLYDLAEKENINVYDCPVADIEGIFLNYQNIKAIGLNYKKIKTQSKEKCILAEELAHYYCDATYKIDSDFQLISKQEYRAKKWCINTLIPFENLQRAIFNRIQYDL